MRTDDGVQIGTPGGAAAERAYIDLVRQIDLRQVLPGQKLPAAGTLAVTLGVSRPPVLQAFQRLQLEGRVSVGAGRRGVVVLPPERSRPHREFQAAQKDWAELGALIEMIEPGIARLLARQALSAETVEQARELITALRASEDSQVRLGLHHGFHLLLCRTTGMKTMEALGILSRQLIAQIFDLVDSEVESADVLAHQQELLLSAVLAGDAAEAAELADRHVAPVRQALASRTDLAGPGLRTAAQR